jgi:hypothetical protein
MESIGATAWHREIPWVVPKVKKRPRAASPLQGTQVGWRLVRKKLADGSMREYRYPRISRAGQSGV